MKKLSGLLLLIFTLSSCGYSKLYPGAERDSSEISRLSISFGGMSAKVKIDNQPVDLMWYNSGVEILPGRHDFFAEFDAAISQSCEAPKLETITECIPVYDADGRYQTCNNQTKSFCLKHCSIRNLKGEFSFSFETNPGETRKFQFNREILKGQVNPSPEDRMLVEFKDNDTLNQMLSPKNASLSIGKRYTENASCF